MARCSLIVLPSEGLKCTVSLRYVHCLWVKSMSSYEKFLAQYCGVRPRLLACWSEGWTSGSSAFGRRPIMRLSKPIESWIVARSCSLGNGAQISVIDVLPLPMRYRRYATEMSAGVWFLVIHRLRLVTSSLYRLVRVESGHLVTWAVSSLAWPQLGQKF